MCIRDSSLSVILRSGVIPLNGLGKSGMSHTPSGNASAAFGDGVTVLRIRGAREFSCRAGPDRGYPCAESIAS